MALRDCPAGGHCVETAYNTARWGNFRACKKCGFRFSNEDECINGEKHFPVKTFALNPDRKPVVRMVCKHCKGFL